MNSLHYFESMDRINRVIQSNDQLDAMMHEVLDEVLEIFGCDRAYLMCPCDPEAPTWLIPMERTRPEYPGAGAGAGALGVEMPMDEEVIALIRLLHACDGVLKFGPGSDHPLPAKVSGRFGFKSFMATPLRPRRGAMWSLAIHQCSYAREWTEGEERLLLEIGRRITDALTSLLYIRELEEREAKYRRFVEASIEGVCALDADQCITFVNPRMCEMTGYSESSLLGLPVTQLMYADDVADFKRHMALRRQGVSEQYEHRFCRKNGSELWTQISAKVLKGDAGEFKGSFAMLTDITGNRRTQDQLALLSFALNNVKESAFLTNSQGEFRYVNEEACRSLGYSREALLMMGVKDIDPDWTQERWVHMWEMNNASQSLTFESTHRTKGGDIFPVEINANLIEYGGIRYGLALVRDIRDRKRSEKELLASEQLFRALVENSPDYISRYDSECRRLYTNPAIQRLFKEDPEKLLHRSPDKGSPVDAPETYIEYIKGVFADGEERLLETLFRTSGGEMHWGHIRFTPEYGPSGEVASVLAIGRDIHEIKESELRLQRFVGNLPAFFFTFRRKEDGGYCFPYASPGIKSLYGLTPEDVREDMAPLHMMAHPEDQLRIEAAIAQAYETLEPFHIEARINRPYMEERWVEVHSVPHREAGGDILWYGIMQDVTDRKQADIRLKRSAEALAEAQRIARLGNWEVFHQGGCKLIWSDEMYDIHEVSKDAFDGSNAAFLALLHPDDRDRVNQVHFDAVYGKQPDYEISYRLLMKDGRIKYVREQGRNYLDDVGRPWRSVGTVQDVTRQQETEIQLQQARKMEALGTLVGGIAHDFNNKLAAITGNLFLLKRKMELEPQMELKLSQVDKLCFEAADMVRQLLTFARKGDVLKESISLGSFVKESAKLNRVAIPENIRLNIFTGDSDLPVMGDITQLQSVLLNLLANARDALDGIESAKIEVHLDRFEPDESLLSTYPNVDRQHSYARIRVRDNGHGISVENMAHIFDPFYTTKPVGKGTGLGLATVYGIVEGHGGFITVESAPGEGACFSVCLPISDEGAEGGGQSREKLIPGQGETILIADDDSMVLESVSDVLTTIGYNVLKAHDGREALEKFYQHVKEIDLVMLDLVMPEMGGLEVARAIREVNAGMKLIFSTGYGEELDEHFPDKATVVGKPYAIEKVSQTIRRQLSLVTGSTKSDC